MNTSGLPVGKAGQVPAQRLYAEGPIVLADFADNPGAGAPGDRTWVLQALLDPGMCTWFPDRLSWQYPLRETRVTDEENARV